jgi:hypothetical protein
LQQEYLQGHGVTTMSLFLGKFDLDFEQAEAHNIAILDNLSMMWH